MRSLILAAFVVLCTLGSSNVSAQSTPRIYIFDNGAIRGLDPGLFNFADEELAETDFVNISYLVVH